MTSASPKSTAVLPPTDTPAAPPAFPPAARRHVAPSGRLELRQILKWLRDDGLLTGEDAEKLLRRFHHTASSLHPLQRLGGAGLADARDGRVLDTDLLSRWLAARFELPYHRIDPLRVDAGRVADVMSAGYAESHRALPIHYGPTEVIVATSEPFDIAWVPEVEAVVKRPVRLQLGHPDDITRFTGEFYSLAASVRGAVRTSEGNPQNNFEQLVELGKTKGSLDANDQGVVQVVDWLWQYAFDQRASDIHLEPRRDIGAIRLRIDGVLHTVHQVPLAVMGAMTARIKLLGRMDVIERRRPQDGRVKTRRPDGPSGPQADVEMRLSTLPTAFGEKVVMRIFDPGTVDKPFDALGFAGPEAEKWRALIAHTHGIILVTGPTGSGKTTTLYSTLKKLATEEVNVCTVEDPIEMVEPSFNQTQVQPMVELDFANGLRALMRQDPDILMVGEIRDLETAEMAIQASLTGHLVFSTLHTNDAPSSITRLVDLGVPPYLISATIIGVLAQRLARTLCPHCKVPDDEAATKMLEELAQPWRLAGRMRPYKPVGCAICRRTGFLGRAALYELMPVTEALRQNIHPVFDTAKLARQAVLDGMRPLRLAGLMKVADGLTTIEEVLRCTPQWSSS